MDSISWKPKDWVEHPSFGLGRVSEDRGDRLDVHFINSGVKTILKTVELIPAPPPSLDFKFPHDKSKSLTRQFKVQRPARRPPLDFNHLVSCFVARFPEGFEGQDFHIEEREYKERAAGILNNKLGKDAFDSLLRAGHYAEACSASIGVLRSTNLVFHIQKAQFKYAVIDKAANHEAFASQLFDLLHGSGQMQERFVAFSNVLSGIGVNYWTIATYYQFLATGGKWMFMKPAVMKKMADSLSISLNYKAEPNWLTYSKLQDLAERVDSELRIRGLVPRSRIDVQGFIWASIGIEEGKYGKTE